MIIIRDDIGEAWEYKDGRIKMLADDTGEDGGYLCDSLEEGLIMLNEMGYISQQTIFTLEIHP